jgi:probable phosphoglycerate mutase
MLLSYTVTITINISSYFMQMERSTPVEWDVPSGFKNRYFIIRHGESEANVAKIVSSTHKVSIANHGLTAKGVEQARSSASLLHEIASKPPASVDMLGNKAMSQSATCLKDGSDIKFYASDFARAYETAYECLESLKPILGAPVEGSKRPSIPLFTTPHLRERSFGDFEGADHTIYHNVWSKDISSPSNSKHFNVESISEVINRTTRFILELE